MVHRVGVVRWVSDARFDACLRKRELSESVTHFLLIRIRLLAIGLVQEILLRGRQTRIIFGFRRFTFNLFLSLDVFLPLILEQPKVLMHFLKSVVLSIERVNDVVLVRVNLLVNVDVLLNELNEFLHLLSEELIDVDFELLSKRIYLIQAW